MSRDRLKALLTTYRDGLLHDTLSFWIPRAIDREYAGYLTALDQDGSMLQSDKSVWVQGRFAWLLATLFDSIERRAEWLDLSRHGIELINRYLARAVLRGARGVSAADSAALAAAR